MGYQVETTKEPTNTTLGKFVRNSESFIDGVAYAYLIAADRIQHTHKYIKPRLEEGNIIISDRYVMSSLVLQRLDGMSLQDIYKLNDYIIKPDLIVLLLSNDEDIRIRKSSRRDLTRMEKQFASSDEIAYYKEASLYLSEKGFEILVVENKKGEIEFTVNLIVKYIVENNLL